ncbi:MAG: VOC family protein [Acidimicrobiia bacterium]|nr:VOC family protein [Acidimicrobiia bacterium]
MDAPVTGFSHLQLRVRDVPACVDWYCAVLGMEVMSEHGDVVALRSRAARMVIVVSPGDPDVDRSPIDHVAFAVPDGPTLEAWAAELRTRGLDVPSIVDESGTPSLQLRDPDGNAVELVAPAPRNG